MKHCRLQSTIAITIFIANAFLALPVLSQQREEVTAAAGQRLLSDYLPSLKDGPGDSPVYILEGSKAGGTVFVCAGTHGNEIAGVVAAIILAENANVLRGRIIVLPRANHSAAMYPDPEKPGPPFIRISTATGERLFAYGSRLTRPVDEWPSAVPDGLETRNLNRAYPGKESGGLTARIAFAISQLLAAESIDVAFDLHESEPESQLSWMIIANPKNVDLAAMAVIGLEEQGLRMGVDSSAREPQGVSHREWGDRTKAKAFLIETPNPAQMALQQIGDPVDDSVLPLGRRVAMQLAAIAEILSAYNEKAPVELQVSIKGIPTPKDIVKAGLGAFLGSHSGSLPIAPIVE